MCMWIQNEEPTLSIFSTKVDYQWRLQGRNNVELRVYGCPEYFSSADFVPLSQLFLLLAMALCVVYSILSCIRRSPVSLLAGWSFTVGTKEIWGPSCGLTYVPWVPQTVQSKGKQLFSIPADMLHRHLCPWSHISEVIVISVPLLSASDSMTNFCVK